MRKGDIAEKLNFLRGRYYGMKVFMNLIFAMSLVAAVLAGCGGEDQGRKYYTEVKSVDKLVLAQMTVTKMATVSDQSLDDAQGLKQTVAAIADAVKIGKRKAAYSYSTYLRAYMDMSDFSPSDIIVDDRNKVIILNLPEIKTEFAGRDLGIREEHYRVSGLRSDINANERAALKERMNETLKKEVKEDPEFRDKLEAQARGKAKDFFTSLLGKDGYTVTVNFRSPTL